MYLSIINIKKKILDLKKERDEMFCMLVEVDYNTQTILLEQIIDLTNVIDNLKKQLEALINENN